MTVCGTDLAKCSQAYRSQKPQKTQALSLEVVAVFRTGV
jgi:hypothetical protein